MNKVLKSFLLTALIFAAVFVVIAILAIMGEGWAWFILVFLFFWFIVYCCITSD